MRKFALVATATALTLTALPASAQMKTSTPKTTTKTTVAATKADNGVRPTHIGGAERAEALAPGQVIWNVGDLSFQAGLIENLELDVNGKWTPGVNIVVPAPGSAGLTGALNLGLGAKYIFLNTDSLSIGVNGRVDLTGIHANTTSTFGVGLPISFWMGKAGLHVQPTIDFANNTNDVGVNLAYEVALNDKWNLFVGDKLAINSNGPVTNQLSGGVRVGFSENLTVDVGIAQAKLNFNPTDIAVNANLLTFNAYFGTKGIDELRSFFGL